MNQQPPTVRLFVFNHECGHLSVGDSELDADCYAVNRGVREHWLDRKGLNQVCDSFEGVPKPIPIPRQSVVAPPRPLLCKGVAEQTPIAPMPVPAKMPPKVPATITASAPAVPARKAAGSDQPKVLSAWRCTDPLDVTTGRSIPSGTPSRKTPSAPSIAARLARSSRNCLAFRTGSIN